MLQWTEQFATGSTMLDEQHRTLIKNINHLEELVRITNPTRVEAEFIISVVNYLESYTQTHFLFEEQCMESYRCPVHQSNKDAHAQFLIFFQNFKQRCAAEGLRTEALASLHQTLSTWIREHILRIDAQLKPCLKR
jgi:hemerythrin